VRRRFGRDLYSPEGRERKAGGEADKAVYGVTILPPTRRIATWTKQYPLSGRCHVGPPRCFAASDRHVVYVFLWFVVYVVVH
jgi:hypothetical protein